MHRNHPSRREVLGGLAVAGLAARLPHAGAEGKPGNAGRFDFHQHADGDQGTRYRPLADGESTS